MYDASEDHNLHLMESKYPSSSDTVACAKAVEKQKKKKRKNKNKKKGKKTEEGAAANNP
jgi:hypothetical protein